MASTLLLIFIFCIHLSLQEDQIHEFNRQWMLNPLLVREVHACISAKSGFDELALNINRGYAPGRGMLRLKVGNRIIHHMFMGMDDLTGNIIRYLLHQEIVHIELISYAVYGTVYVERKINSIGNPYIKNNKFLSDHTFNFEEEWMYLSVMLRELRVSVDSDFDELARTLNSTGHLDCYGRGVLRLQIGANIVHHRFFKLENITGNLIRYLLYGKVDSASDVTRKFLYETAYVEKTENDYGYPLNKPSNALAMDSEIIRQASAYVETPFVVNPNCVDCNKVDLEWEENSGV